MSKKLTGGKLNAKQERFVAEYLFDSNATQAAIRAGYSPKTAGQQGERLLKNVEIKAALSVAVAKQQRRTEISADLVLGGLLTEATGTGIDSTPASRVSAWSLLAKHLGIVSDKVDMTVRGKEAAARELAQMLGNVKPEDLVGE